MESSQLSSARGRPPPSPYSSYGGFQLPSSSSSDSGAGAGGGGGAYRNNGLGIGVGIGDDDDDFGDDDDLDLPFPTALSRKDFLTPAFDATAYLSSLFRSGDDGTSAQLRHQTLEDLRAELRERSSAISAELLELVNANYTSFLGLGDELKGGDEKVEDVRVALFGFRRSVEDVQARVRERRVAVGAACQELGQVRTAIDTGRRLLELDERVAQLEERLSIGENGAHPTAETQNDDGLDFADMDDDDEEDEDEEEEEEEKEARAGTGAGAGGVRGTENENADDEITPAFVASGPRKLGALARDLLLATRLADSLGHQLPFVKKMDERLDKCESTLILDLNAAVKEARSISRSKNKAAQARLLKLLAIYRVLDREDEAVRVLKER
ncbi:uncharacterized protein SPSK_07671 [Sporothrix schenckii 1099-18]|uniref:Conserved oligomeric Golgi complex subunit 2 n=1 Tax=Sporothrix schenckii 1099-18 TaxID=1397361 RepID=A0A0F2MK50_SPOSC|nr:uncharacterized protein SPSK_07671 [Sporothrix schenckii 1099-18]KJR88561.1 hypothetical protein SPSK_07671 [Sporothrix schenckii 1099-18]